ncbi:unnamed protein product, partial [Oikopleura dioica]
EIVGILFFVSKKNPITKIEARKKKIEI